jgi:hypothetical protein
LERQRAAGQNRAESPNCPGHSPQASHNKIKIKIKAVFFYSQFCDVAKVSIINRKLWGKKVLAIKKYENK